MSSDDTHIYHAITYGEATGLIVTAEVARNIEESSDGCITHRELIDRYALDALQRKIVEQANFISCLERTIQAQLIIGPMMGGSLNCPHCGKDLAVTVKLGGIKA